MPAKVANFVLVVISFLAVQCSTMVTRDFNFRGQTAEKERLDCPERVIDRDGNLYNTVVIGGQCWTAENLSTAHYRDGSAVEQTVVIDLKQYGRLYTFASVQNPKGLCPEGWHVPSDEEFQSLERAVGLDEAAAKQTGWRGSDNESRKLKKLDYAYSWTDEERNRVNESGFSLLPGGESLRLFTGADGSYLGLWTSTSEDEENAWARYLVWMAIHPRNDEIWRKAVDKERGYYVRCLKD